MDAAKLQDRAVIALTGPEARSYLQGLITNDVEKVQPGAAIYAALLAPQGKILFDFFVVAGDGALLLDCAADTAEALLKRLSMYRLRAKVKIAARPQLGVYVALAGHPENRPVPFADRAITFADPRLAALPARSIGAIQEMPAELGDATPYHAARLVLGVPESADFGSDRIFALDAGLDELHAIAFDKGCYIGQELTARMKHRGTARKRLLVVAADAPLPPPGAEIAGGLGEIVSVYGTKGFALIRLDRLETFSGQKMAGPVPVTLTRQSWL